MVLMDSDNVCDQHLTHNRFDILCEQDLINSNTARRDPNSDLVLFNNSIQSGDYSNCNNGIPHDEFSNEALPHAKTRGEKYYDFQQSNPGKVTWVDLQPTCHFGGAIHPTPLKGTRTNPGTLHTSGCNDHICTTNLMANNLGPAKENSTSPALSHRQPEPHTPPTGPSTSPETANLTFGLPTRDTQGNTHRTNSGMNSQASVHTHSPSIQVSTHQASQPDHNRISEYKGQYGNITPPHNTLPPTPATTQVSIDLPKEDPFFPTFDQKEVENHSQRIASIWPYPTPQAMEQFPEFCKTYCMIKSFNLPNVLGARLTLKSGLNLANWERHLRDYHDKEVCSFLRFGWPLGYSADSPPTSIPDNHPSGTNHMEHVNTFIQTELAHKAIVGPFKEPPFFPWTRNNPIMSRPKKDTQARRIIIDLTFPDERGVNQGIDIHSILGRDISYTLPNIWDLTTCLKDLGTGAWVWKADLQRAYRQLRVDPLDTPFLAMQTRRGTFLDLCPSFGCRSSSAACQRTSNAVVYLMRKEGFVTYAYLDDYAGCSATEEEAIRAYNYFIALTNNLGLKLATEKCQPPQQHVTWLGYTVDTLKMQVSIPLEKVQELKAECQAWMSRQKANKRMLQSLLGKILHAAGCIKNARKFTARLLSTLRSLGKRYWTTINDECKADIRWFLEYASHHANGVSLYAPALDLLIIECNACLTGAGGHTNTHYYEWTYEQHHRSRFPNIHQLEAVNVLVALRTLAPPHLQHVDGVIIFTDNISASFSLATGKTHDDILGACARELWLEGAIMDIDIQIEHKPGKQIPLADALSRAASDPAMKKYVTAEVKTRNLAKLPTALNGYKFFIDTL